MATSPVASDASHESDNDEQNAANSKGSAAKDKECQYCHQKFTSSSLGRHLDQFISKKKPDGVHDVEEIKKLRAGITRRIARGGKKTDGTDQLEGDGRTSHSSPSQSSNTVPTPVFLDSLNKPQPGTSNDTRFNRIAWQATGVITDPLQPGGGNPATASPLLSSGNNILAGSKRSFSTYAADLPVSSANEHARALELSLREVLDAVTAATNKTAPLPQPFPFELTSLSFPALCLALLPTPATLFQSSPFATSTTISLKPPGFEQLEALRSKIRATLDQWKWDALGHAQRFSIQHGMSVGEEAERLSQTTQKRIADAMHHLDTAFQFFMANSPEQQYQLWSIELLRAFKKEQDKLKEANEKIDRIAQEASQLQQQIDHLSRCQWPREMALWPPDRLTFSAAVQKELQDAKTPAHTSLDIVNAYGTAPKPDDSRTAIEDRWDFDKLVNKWKRHVREDRARRGGSGSMLPPLPENLHADTGRTDTPPSSLRKAMSEAQNGTQRSTSSANSPTFRNGVHPPSSSLGITDKPVTFMNAAPNSSMQRPFAGTPSNHSSTPRTQTPTNHPMSNVQIISDVHDHMARFQPWLQQQKELEAQEQSEVDVGD